MRKMIALALSIAVMTSAAQAAAARGGSILGTWFVQVSPQAVPPDFPEAPPPFVGMFSFDFTGGLQETDSAVNPNSVISVFPPEVLPPHTGSDGLGSWRRSGYRSFRAIFVKFLFDTNGQQIALISTTLDLSLSRAGQLSGSGTSDYIMGSDPAGPVFFSGPVVIEGARLKPAF